MEDELKTVIGPLERATIADKDTLEALHVEEGYDLAFPAPFDSSRSLQCLWDEVCELVYFVSSAEHCQLQHISELSRKMLTYVLYVYNLHSQKTFSGTKKLHGQDVAWGCLHMVDDVIRTANMLKEVGRVEEPTSSKGADEQGEEKELAEAVNDDASSKSTESEEEEEDEGKVEGAKVVERKETSSES